MKIKSTLLNNCEQQLQLLRPLRILIRVTCVPPDPEMARYGTIGWKKDRGPTDSHILWVSPV